MRRWLSAWTLSGAAATALAAHPVDDLSLFTAAPSMAARLGIVVDECPVELGTSEKIDLAKVELVSHTSQWKPVHWMWTWKEYRIKASGALCIELLEPLATLLGRDHAAIFAMHNARIGRDGAVIDDAAPGKVLDNGRVESLDDYLPPFEELPASQMHPVDKLRPLTPPPDRASSYGLSLTHCPLAGASPTLVDLTRLGTPATYAQRINSSEWTWREYSVPPTGETCIVLIVPPAGPLGKAHASVLAMLTHGVLPDGSRTLPAFTVKGVQFFRMQPGVVDNPIGSFVPSGDVIPNEP